MATLYSDARGAVVRFLQSAQWETQYPTPPAEAAHTLAFDDQQNAALVADIQANWNAYTYDGTTLRKADQAVAIAADSAEATIRKALATLLPQLLAGTASAANAQKALYVALRALGRAGLL